MQVPLHDFTRGLDRLSTIAYDTTQSQVVADRIIGFRGVPNQEVITEFSTWIGGMLLDCTREMDNSYVKVSIQEKIIMPDSIHDDEPPVRPIGPKHTLTLKCDPDTWDVRDVRGFSTGTGGTSPNRSYYSARSLNARQVTAMLHIFNEYIAERVNQ